MLTKLGQLYPRAIFSSVKPDLPITSFHLFFDEKEGIWMAIQKNEISEKEVELLKTIYTVVEEQPKSSITTNEQKWYKFLFSDELHSIPVSEAAFRFIQFQIDAAPFEKTEVEFAFKGFFSDDITIIWESATAGVIVEDKNHSYMSEKEFIAMAETLENDLYSKVFFFLGKYHNAGDDIRTHFQNEKKYFEFALSSSLRTFIYTFERIFPLYLAYFLPQEFQRLLMTVVADVFNEDPEMYTTITVFLENNLNASLTAKKLYIHRNTLQYRLDKFSEKTGIQLKDFAGAFTVYLACQVFYQANNTIHPA